ncbi:MAG: hypothetical protein NTY76_00270 [Candidatus Omnitrophica bacterium]|nr:hypothetical protein [Candidatus Omnitrophota bacterium]
MTNIFILYIPKGNYEALVHYEDTIKKKVAPDRISRHVDSNLQHKLTEIFGNKRIAVWGSRDSLTNRARFQKMKPGDDILIVEGETIKLLGKIATTTINPSLSKELWKNIKDGRSDGWDLIYFIANPLEIELPFREFKKLFGYAINWGLRGFTSIAENKLTEFYNKYDDLYSILQCIKNGQKIEEKKAVDTEKNDKLEKTEITKDDIDDILDNKTLSDHIVMQWKLIRLGMKSGSRVWIPKNDQPKITTAYGFKEFEKEFTSGIDTPARYVENIDVVWKEEFRIDAAFEVENTTSIYSGLLRFSDLKLVAPNSNYPLFIVAPTAKRNRVMEQVKRPTFKTFNFEKKVRYLSYEALDEVDKFFESSNSGLNVDLLVGKSEMIN